jgi:hypothetical protein
MKLGGTNRVIFLSDPFSQYAQTNPVTTAVGHIGPLQVLWTPNLQTLRDPIDRNKTILARSTQHGVADLDATAKLRSEAVGAGFLTYREAPAALNLDGLLARVHETGELHILCSRAKLCGSLRNKN